MTLPTLPAPHVALLCLTLLSAVTDVRRGLIPNWLTFPAIALGLAMGALAAGWGGLAGALSSLAVCGAVPLALFAVGGMGGGDVKLFAAIGALVGVREGLSVQMLAYLLTGLYGGALLAHRGTLLASIGGALVSLVPGRRAALAIAVDSGGGGDAGCGGAGGGEGLQQQVRLGAAIAMASACVVAEAHVRLPWVAP